MTKAAAVLTLAEAARASGNARLESGYGRCSHCSAICPV
jgi:hypothetical protein